MRKREIFSFLTITYNNEKYIIQHLESIKYQIQNFGINFSFQLIIADDCSRDKTIRIIEGWLSENSKLFIKIDLLRSRKNLGTCNNYCAGLRKIEGTYFKALAGDDLYSKENIFNVIPLLHDYDIIVTPIGEFHDHVLFDSKKIYSRIFTMYKYTNTDYSKLAKWFVPIPMTPGVFLRKELISDEVIAFIENYSLIEDFAQSIKIYETNKNLKIRAYEKICVLYRHHGNAVTKTDNTRIIALSEQDKISLNKYILKNTRNNFVKLYFLYRLTLVKIPSRRISQLLNYHVFLYRVRFLLYYIRHKEEMGQIVLDSYLPNKEYLLSIQR